MFEDDFAASPGASQASAGTGSFVFGNSMQDDQGKDSADHMDEDIAKLRDALWNEKASPEILPFEEGIVEDLMELVEHQVSNLRGSFLLPRGMMERQILRSLRILKTSNLSLPL